MKLTPEVIAIIENFRDVLVKQIEECEKHAKRNGNLQSAGAYGRARECIQYSPYYVRSVERNQQTGVNDDAPAFDRVDYKGLPLVAG